MTETADLWTETITASCQDCGTEVSGEFLVSSDLARHDAIGFHARRHGWLVGLGCYICPGCRR